MKKMIVTLSTMGLIMVGHGFARGADESVVREWDFEAKKIWEVRQIGGDELLRPAEPRIADDGTLYFHDFERHVSYIIDGDGNPVGTFAPRGSGEGEVPMYINCFPAGDQVAICGMDRLHFFTKNGKYVKAVPNNPFVRFPLAFKSENQFWVAPGALGDAPGSLAVVTHVDLATGEETPVYKFTRTEVESMPTGGAVVIGLTPQIKLTFDRQADRIYFGKNSDTVVYRAASDGDKVESFSFTTTPQPVTEADKREHFARFDIPEESLAQLIAALPDRMTYYHQIKVLGGLVYLFSAGSIGHEITGQDINVYTPDGRHVYYGRIDVEEGWHIASPDNLQMADGIVYAIQENDDGVRKIVKYAITLP